MSLIRSGQNKGVEEWLPSAVGYGPNQRVFGFFVMEDKNSESEDEEKNNDKPDNHEGTSPGEETNDGDDFSNNKLDIPVKYRTCTCEHRDKAKSQNGRCRFCGFDLAHVKLPGNTWTLHGVTNSVESSSNSHPSTSPKSRKQNQQGNENNRKKNAADKKLKREADKGNLKTGCWECELCSRKFTHLFRLNKHYRNDHEIRLRFSCGKCNKLFRYFNNYKSHLRGHSGVQTDGNQDRKRTHDDGNKREQPQSKIPKQNIRYKCPFPSCGHTFLDLNELKEHMRIRHGVNMGCFRSIPQGPLGPWARFFFGKRNNKE